MKYRPYPAFAVITAAFILAGCATTSSTLRSTGLFKASDFTGIGGESYIPVSTFSSRLAMSSSEDPVSKVTEMSGDGYTVKFMPGSDIALVNGSTVELDAPVESRGGSIFIPKGLAELIVKSHYKAGKDSGQSGGVPRPERAPSIRTIVIDAGHGGKDPGAIGRGSIREKHIVLDIAQKLRGALKKRGNFKIVMTRDTDKFISLNERTRIANNAKADLFISVHANAAKSRSASGFEVYYLSSALDDDARALEVSENSVLEYENGGGAGYLNATLWDMILTENRDESRELASSICNSSKGEYCVRTRGVKTARFYVLKGSHMPAVLVEVGYISNTQEAKNLNMSSYRQKIAEAIADGVIGHIREFERTEGFTK